MECLLSCERFLKPNVNLSDEEKPDTAAAAGIPGLLRKAGGNLVNQLPAVRFQNPTASRVIPISVDPLRNRTRLFDLGQIQIKIAFVVDDPSNVPVNEVGINFGVEDIKSIRNRTDLDRIRRAGCRRRKSRSAPGLPASCCGRNPSPRYLSFRSPDKADS